MTARPREWAELLGAVGSQALGGSFQARLRAHQPSGRCTAGNPLRTPRRPHTARGLSVSRPSLVVASSLPRLVALLYSEAEFAGS